MTTRIIPDDARGRAAAAAVLREGGIVALPTDTVYGIAVDLAAPDGIERLFAAKHRPPDRAIMLLLADAAQASRVGRWGPAADALARAFWPGGLSLVLPQRRGASLPHVLTGGSPTIGVRLPDHAAPRALAAAVGALPTTSANVSGQPEAATAGEIREQLGDAIDLVLDGGPAHGGPPSTVVDCSGPQPRVLRVGAVRIEQLAEVLAAAGVPLAAADVGR